MIEEWKKKYGKIFKVKIDGSEITYRNLTIDEVLQLQGKEDTSQDLIADIVILKGDKPKTAGGKLALANYVIKSSSFRDEDDVKMKILEERNKQGENFYSGLISRICSIFPYKPDELKSRTLDQLLELVVMAETASGAEIIETGIKKKKSKIPTAMPALWQRK
jgi:hypothetical protein